MEVISASGVTSLGASHSVKAEQAMLRLCGGYSACTVASDHSADLYHNLVFHGLIFSSYSPSTSFLWASSFFYLGLLLACIRLLSNYKY